MSFTEKNILKQIEIWNSENLSNNEISEIFDMIQIESIDNKIKTIPVDSYHFWDSYFGESIAIYIVTRFKDKSIFFDTKERKFYFLTLEEYVMQNKDLCSYLGI